jgi:hypothetical protein
VIGVERMMQQASETGVGMRPPMVADGAMAADGGQRFFQWTDLGRPHRHPFRGMAPPLLHNGPGTILGALRDLLDVAMIRAAAAAEDSGTEPATDTQHGVRQHCRRVRVQVAESLKFLGTLA